MKKNVAKLGLMLTLSGVALAACSTDDGGNGSDAGSGSGDDQTIKAVATTTQICDYLTQIAQDGMTLHKVDSSGKETTEGDGDTTLDLTCLLAPNASAHEHEMTPQQMSARGPSPARTVRNQNSTTIRTSGPPLRTLRSR